MEGKTDEPVNEIKCLTEDKGNQGNQENENTKINEITQNAINKQFEKLNVNKGTICPLISGGVNYII
jgi:hypothetical protein